MQSIRSAVRPIARQSAAALSRRGYAEVADGKLALSLVLPHQALYSAQGVVQVNIPAATGDMGILANHVPSVEALRPGVVEVIEDAGQASKKWFGEFCWGTGIFEVGKRMGFRPDVIYREFPGMFMMDHVGAMPDRKVLGRARRGGRDVWVQ